MRMAKVSSIPATSPAALCHILMGLRGVFLILIFVSLCAGISALVLNRSVCMQSYTLYVRTGLFASTVLSFPAALTYPGAGLRFHFADTWCALAPASS